MANVAVITARGGSKRIPRKNIKFFRDKPIIAYSIQTALQSGLFDTVMVSTDDAEIAEISIKYGAEVPFYRSPATADDHSGTAEVMLEVIGQLIDTGKEFEFACCLYPTAPLIKVENLRAGYEILRKNGYTSVFPVCPFPYPIYRALQIGQDGKVGMIWPENLNQRSQDLPPAWHDAGQFYWMHIPSFLKEKKLLTSNSGSIILNELQVQDIDNETDWKMAEIKYSILFPDE
jgi:pseudaminic acid cytidylyltransferase